MKVDIEIKSMEINVTNLLTTGSKIQSDNP